VAISRIKSGKTTADTIKQGGENLARANGLLDLINRQLNPDKISTVSSMMRRSHLIVTILFRDKSIVVKLKVGSKKRRARCNNSVIRAGNKLAQIFKGVFDKTTGTITLPNDYTVSSPNDIIILTIEPCCRKFRPSFVKNQTKTPNRRSPKIKIRQNHTK